MLRRLSLDTSSSGFGALAVVLLLLATAGCGGDPLARATADPRAGRPLGRGAVIVYSSRYEVDLPGMDLNPRFDARKCSRVAEALVRDGYLSAEDLVVPPEVTREELLLVHTAAYLDSLGQPPLVAEIFNQGVVRLLSASTIDRRILAAFRRATGGTILAARRALEGGLAVNLGGGYHHAHPDHGMGACVYADVPIAVRVLQKEKLVRRVLVVDGNVHQGNGLAVCFAGDPDVFTFSIHEADLWPVEKPPNDLDLGLKLPVDDATYLAALSERLPAVIRDFKPELVIFIAGADVQAGDPNGHFGLTPAGILRRDEYVAGLARSAGIPLLYLIGGGYFRTAWQTQVASIANLLEKFAGVTPRAAAANSGTPPNGQGGMATPKGSP